MACKCKNKALHIALAHPMPINPEHCVESMDVFPLVHEDLKQREAKGIETYGVSLQTFNGRDALQDAYEEALDLALYLRQKIEELKNG